MCLIKELEDGEIKLTPTSRSKQLNNLRFLEEAIKFLKIVVLWNVTLVVFPDVSKELAASILPSKY